MKKEMSFVKKIFKKAVPVLMAGALAASLAGCGQAANAAGGEGEALALTNVSYDPTRELYAAYNELFAKYYEEKTGKQVTVTQSHGGSGGQARSVVEGADADVVTLALEHDITLIEEAGLIKEGWLSEFPLP